MPRAFPPWGAFALILAVALVVRLAGVAWWESRHPDRFYFGDSDTYWTLARTIAKAEEYQYGPSDGKVFRMPGYPALLVPCFWLGGDDPPVVWGRLHSALLGTLAVAAVYGLARVLFDGRTAAVAAWLCAIYPGSVALGLFVLSEAPFTPVMVAQLALWSLCWKRRGTGAAWLCAGLTGAAAGMAVLMRPSWLLFTPFALGIGLLVCGERRRQCGYGLAAIGVMAAVLVPWWIRNWTVIGRFVPTTLQMGASLYDGLGPQATGASNFDFMPAIAEDERRRGGADPLEYRLDRRLSRAALAAARQDPLRVLALAGTKFLRMWNVWPNEPGLRSAAIRVVMLVSYPPLLVLGVLGGLRYGRRGWPYVLCLLPAVYLTLLHVIFVSSLRYREPALMPIIVLAGGMLLRPPVPSDAAPAA